MPVVQETWGRSALNVEYFSEIADPKYKTRTLPNVKNTDKGHCKKTQSIIEYFHQKAPELGWKWLVIADDDTILSPAKMLALLKCYDDDGKEMIHLGQRYGFNIATGNYGYDYITGGGGMIFNFALVNKIVKTQKFCSCPRDDSPDDMHFGACLSNLAIALVHNPKFHQGRPEDYHPDLFVQDPVSFHKFWNTDPRKTYDRFFRESDAVLSQIKKTQTRANIHEEL